ncbi:MAG: PIN domain-containing protein [Candidatus Aenigmarchaeota archaeon]|nr:PIN domain-containing protein [Candidatus Aenigmarchaeota archaeon]
MPESFFFDSYAIIELIKGGVNYRNYTNVKMVTTKLNLFEVCYFLVRDFGEDKALEYMKSYSDFIVDFSVETILAAAKFRLVKKADRLSMVDCIGYVLSKNLGIKFLTGDEKFQNMENVEYVK